MADNIELTGRFSGYTLDIIATIQHNESEPQRIKWSFKVPVGPNVTGRTEGEMIGVGAGESNVQVIQVSLAGLSPQELEALKSKQIVFDISLTAQGSKADSETKTIGQLFESARQEQEKRVI